MGKLHCGAMVFASVGIILIIVALATPAWMTGCLLYDNIIAATKKLLQASGQEAAVNVDAETAMMTGMKLCIHQGLFTVSLSVSGVNVAMSVNVSATPSHVLIAMIGLIVGAISMVAGLVLHIRASRADGSSYEEKSKAQKDTHRATIVVVAATILLLGGMMAYTIGTSHVVHQPIQYMAQFGQSLMGSFSSFGQGGTQEENPFGLGRKKRDVDVSGVDDTIQEYISTMVEGMDPVYGYSFIIGWVSVVVAVVTLAFSVGAKMALARGAGYSGGTPKANV